MTTIVEVDFGKQGYLEVIKHPVSQPLFGFPVGMCDAITGNSDRYDVIVDGETKHPNCSAEDVMRALGHYIQSLSNKIS